MTRLMSQCKLVFRSLCKFLAGMNISSWLYILLLLVTGGIWLYHGSSIPYPSDPSVSNLGAYGDSFGVLTSFFTALGFCGLIINLLMQQRQIDNQENYERSQHEIAAKARYEDVLFRLLDKYSQTLSEVQVGNLVGREVLKDAINRVNIGLQGDGSHNLPTALISKRDQRKLSEKDKKVIDYFHYRNFKIVSTEINPQGRLVDSLEVLLSHMYHGIPDRYLLPIYIKMVFAQITFIEIQYFYLVALAHSDRELLRHLLRNTGFLDRVSKSQTYRLHREMYKEYWGDDVGLRLSIPASPMSDERIRDAFRAFREHGGVPNKTYKTISVLRSENATAPYSSDADA